MGSVLDLRIPRNLTAAMQLLQRLVGREHLQRYCQGTISCERLASFLYKMSDRYPAIARNARQRSYDRARGRAVMHMVIVISNQSDECSAPVKVHWVLLSSEGFGGLADPQSHDHAVSRDAMAASTHLELDEYVLLYAHKLVLSNSREDGPRIGRRRALKGTSTWTWRIRGDVLRQLRAAIDECCERHQLGVESTSEQPGSGLRGLLAAQRHRPLFAGVRSQVIDLQRYAIDRWRRLSPGLADHDLLSPQCVARSHLPPMRQIPFYTGLPTTVVRLLGTICR